MRNKKINDLFNYIITDKVGHNEWCYNDDFANDIGLDSMEFMDLIVEVEDQFNLKPIKENFIEDITTPEDLLKYIYAQL